MEDPSHHYTTPGQTSWVRTMTIKDREFAYANRRFAETMREGEIGFQVQIFPFGGPVSKAPFSSWQYTLWLAAHKDTPLGCIVVYIQALLDNFEFYAFHPEYGKVWSGTDLEIVTLGAIVPDRAGHSPKVIDFPLTLALEGLINQPPLLEHSLGKSNLLDNMLQFAAFGLDRQLCPHPDFAQLV